MVIPNIPLPLMKLQLINQDDCYTFFIQAGSYQGVVIPDPNNNNPNKADSVQEIPGKQKSNDNKVAVFFYNLCMENQKLTSFV